MQNKFQSELLRTFSRPIFVVSIRKNQISRVYSVQQIQKLFTQSKAGKTMENS